MRITRALWGNVAADSVGLGRSQDTASLMSTQARPQRSARGEDLGRGQHHAGRSAPTTLLRKGEEIRFLEQEVLT